MYKVGARVIRVQTGQHYVISKIETKRADGSLLKKETRFHLKHERGPIDLIVSEDELKTLFSPIKQTNADRIRSMTDEELAEIMSETSSCYYCKVQCEDRPNNPTQSSCNFRWLKWLKAESEE